MVRGVRSSVALANVAALLRRAQRQALAARGRWPGRERAVVARCACVVASVSTASRRKAPLWAAMDAHGVRAGRGRWHWRWRESRCRPSIELPRVREPLPALAWQRAVRMSSRQERDTTRRPGCSPTPRGRRPRAGGCGVCGPPTRPPLIAPAALGHGGFASNARRAPCAPPRTRRLSSRRRGTTAAKPTARGACARLQRSCRGTHRACPKRNDPSISNARTQTDAMLQHPVAPRRLPLPVPAAGCWQAFSNVSRDDLPSVLQRTVLPREPCKPSLPPRGVLFVDSPSEYQSQGTDAALLARHCRSIERLVERPLGNHTTVMNSTTRCTPPALSGALFLELSPRYCRILSVRNEQHALAQGAGKANCALASLHRPTSAP